MVVVSLVYFSCTHALPFFQQIIIHQKKINDKPSYKIVTNQLTPKSKIQETH